MTVAQAKKAVSDKLSHFFGVDPKTATNEQYYKAVSMIVRDKLSEMNSEFRSEAKGQDSKEIYYLCMEFLMGRSLKNNLYNLDLVDTFDEALKAFDVKLDRLYDEEIDAGLGNGGLADLQPAILTDLQQMDSSQWAILSAMRQVSSSRSLLTAGRQSCLISGFRAVRYGLFRVRRDPVRLILKDGLKTAGTVTITTLSTGIAILLQPCLMICMFQVRVKAFSRLRLWAARKPELDMGLFNSGSYVKAMEQSAMAEAISKVLYPADNTQEGKSLRLRQQYFPCFCFNSGYHQASLNTLRHA